MGVLAQSLRAICLFDEFDDAELDLVREAVSARDYAARAIVFLEGEPSPSNHYRHLASLSSRLALGCSTPRLIDLLLACADERGCVTDRGIELDLDVTQDLLASQLSTTRQMIAQNFLRLERAGALDARGKHIVILDREGLAKML